MLQKETVEEINGLIVKILERDVGKLLHNSSKWGEVNFEEIRDDVVDIQSIVRPIANLPIRFIPQGDGSAIRARLNSVEGYFTDIEEYRTNIDGHVTERESIINNVPH